MTDIVETLESIADGVTEVQGAVTVEIKDERGKTVDYEKKPNFISKAWKAYARAVLRTKWMAYAYNPSFTGSTSPNGLGFLWTMGKASVPVWPHRNIACWNQTTAEDSVNEVSPIFPVEGLIAWASRYPYGSASGARGAVNTTESTITDFQVRHVYDWLTSQGNGTFQSVGYLDLAAPGASNQGIPKPNLGGFRRRFVTSVITPTNIITGATSLMTGGGWINPANGRYYFTVRRYAPNSHQNLRICSVDLSGMDKSLDNTLGIAADVTGLTVTNESAEFTVNLMDSVSTNGAHGCIGIDGSNFIFYCATSSSVNTTYIQLGKVASTGASTFIYGNNTTQGFTGHGAVLGGYAYLSNAYANGFRVNKHLISTLGYTSGWNLDANATAHCTAAGITTPQVHNITTDGTDLICTVGQQGTSSTLCLLFKISTAGVTLEYYGMGFDYNSSASSVEPASAPYNFGNSNLYYPRAIIWNQENTNNEYQANGVSGSYDPMSTTAYSQNDTGTLVSSTMYDRPGLHQMLWYDGCLHYIRYGETGTSNTNQFTWCMYRRGYDLGSRVLLATPKIKLNTQTMKITYDITLPGFT